MKKRSQSSSAVMLPSARSAANNHHEADELLPQLLTALLAYKSGDFSVRLPADWTGVAGKIADGFNDVVAFNQRLTIEPARVSHAVGKEGKLKQRVSLSGATGDWANKVES